MNPTQKQFLLNCAESKKQSPLRKLAILTGLALVAAVLACAQAPQFMFSSNESGITWTCSMDGGQAQSCTSPQNYSQQSSGQHVFKSVGTYTVPVPPQENYSLYRNSVLADHPSQDLRFSEPSGSVAFDSSAHATALGGHNGSYVNVTLGAPGAMYGDTAVNLGGSGWVDSTYNPFAAGSSRTFEGWANASSGVASTTLFSSDLVSASTLPWLYFDNPNTISFYPQNAAAVSWAYTWPANQWVMWDLTYNDSTHVADLFINGVDQGAKTVSQGYASITGNVEVGAGGGWGSFPGSMNEFAVYPAILSAARIQAHYQAGQALPPQPVPQFTFGSNQIGVIWTCAMDGAQAQSCASPQSYNQQPGQHTLTLTGTYTVTVAGVAYQSAVLADGPSQYLRFNESSGAIADDSSGNGNNGTYVGGTLGVSGPVSGDTAVNLGGSGYVDSAYNPFAAGSSRTFEGWANASSGVASTTLFSSDLAPATTNPWLYFTTSNEITFYPQNAAGVSWTYSWPTNQWVLWDLTYNDSTHVADLFINGVDQGSKTASQGYASTTGNIEVGAGGNWSIFPGSMGEFAVYPSILSAARIQARYNAAGSGSGGGGGGSQGRLGVKIWDGVLPDQVIPAAALSDIHASGQLYFVGSTSGCPPTLAPGSIAQLDTGGWYNLNFVPCAVQVTGGNGGWYGIGNEPEDVYSDNTDPQTFATQLHGYVQAIRALDPNAHFFGPDLTTWNSVTDPSYPWGPPETWFQTMYNDYETTYGVPPPYDALTVHCYINDNGNTAFTGPQPYMQMIDSFKSAAASYGYSTVWMTEGGVFFDQPITQALSSAQLQLLSQYITNLLANTGRVYYFMGGPQGWVDGANSVKAPFDATNDWAITDVGQTIAANDQ